MFVSREIISANYFSNQMDSIINLLEVHFTLKEPIRGVVEKEGEEVTEG